MKKTSITILAAAGATLCCTGPVLFTALGATSLGALTALEPLRPYLSLAAVGLLGLAYWRSYRPGTVAACCTIDEKTSLRRQRGTLGVTSLIVILFLGFPYVADDALFAGDAPLTDPVEQIVTWRVEGMTCSGCALGLEASLTREPGMLVCHIRYDEAEMDCRLDEVQLTAQTIPALLSLYGYQASLQAEQS